MSEWTGTPRVDSDGRRRPLELTAKLRAAVEAYTPIPQWKLHRVDEMVYHLCWPDVYLALCGIRASKEPAAAPDSPFLCGACAWKFEIATGQELVE